MKDNGVSFMPPKAKHEDDSLDPHSVYLRTIIHQNEEIIRLLSIIVKDRV